ncbi:MAG: hypothetical protein KDA46_04250 [Parvularculaceae bacterium]|nr:hypothetical protein [Parvularculaceae bacterium]
MKSILIIGGLMGGLLAAASCASTPVERVNEAAAAKLAEFDRTDDVRSCISSRTINSLTAVDESTLLVRVGVNEYYVNDLTSRCNGATGNSNRFEYTTSTSQLCRNDILRVVDNTGGFLTGSCGVGSFVKLAPKAVDEAAQ